MNYLTVISVDNTIEANYRIILYSPSSFSISTKKATHDFLGIKTLSHGFFYDRKGVLIFFLLSQKWSPAGEVKCLTLEIQSFLMISKLSVFNNINMKNRTWDKVVNIASPKSPLFRPLKAFSITLSWIRKGNKVSWQRLLTLRQLVNQSCIHIKNGSLLPKNKQEWTK